MENLQRKRMMRSVTFWRSLVLPLLSLLASGVIVAAAIHRFPFSDPSPALLLSGLIATALLASILLFVFRRLAQEMQVCDPSLRRLIIALIAGGIIAVVFFSIPALAPCTLMWRWGAGSQTGAEAPVFPAASWGVSRPVIDLHPTNDPGATPFGVWRAVASLDEAACVQPAQAELWLTQPSWAVIDATTGRPPPTADGVDVVIGVQRGQELLLERRIALDPPATPEEGRWHHVMLDLPPGAERLVVEVQMRSTLDYDRVWMTEAVVRPTWGAVIDRAAFMLIVALSVSILAFAWRIQLVVRVARSISRFFAVHGWLVVGLSCLWLAYMLVWQRGFFLDDWSVGFRARDWRTLEWLPIKERFLFRVLTYIVTPRLVALMWTDEFLVRLLIAGCVGLNAFLLGWLVYRMLHSRLPAIVAGWLFLAPVSPHVPLWAGAVTYVFITGTTLLMLHVIWSALVVDDSPYIWLLLAGSLMLITLLWCEATVGVVIVIPIMGILYRIQRPEVRLCTVARRAALGFVVPTIVIVLYTFLVILGSGLAKERGGITTDIALIVQRAYGFLEASYLSTLHPRMGYLFLVSSYSVGLDHVLSLYSGVILLSGISIVLGLAVVNWRSDGQFSKISEVLLMIVLGTVWFLATSTLPYAVVSQQGFEPRFVYFPLAGASIATGALVFLIASVIRRRGLQQALLAACGVLLIILSICTVGSARMYKVRYEQDVNMFKTLRRLAPFEALPEHPQFIPVNLDYSLPGMENLTGWITGAFEAHWAAYSGLFMITYPEYEVYRFGYFEYIVSASWFPTTFSERVPDKYLYFCSTRHTDVNVFVQDCPIDSKRAIVFTHHNGELVLVRTLTLQRSDGTTRIVELPLVSRLAARGSTVIETLEVPVKD